MNNNMKTSKKIKRLIRDIIFIMVWIGVIIKFLIVDWDVLLVEKYFPNFDWILNYKILGFVILIFLTSKMKIWSIILNFLYFLFMPIIIIFGFIPFKIFSIGKWNGIISYINTIIIFFKHFRYKLIMVILYVLSLILIINQSNNVVLIICILFHIYCLSCLVKSIVKIAFFDSEIYAAYKKLVNLIKNRKESKESEEYLNIATIEELKENKEMLSMIESKVLINRLLLFSAKKLKDYNNSRTYLLQDIIIFIMTMIIGILSFTSINYGIFKINNFNFNFNIIGNNLNFIDFILYVISGANDYIAPSTMLTKILEIIKGIIVFVFSALFVCTFLEGSKKKQKEELENIISYMESTAKEEEMKIVKKDLFEDMNSVISSLEQMKSSLIGIIIKITQYL